MLKKIISLVTLASFLLYSNAFIAPAMLHAVEFEGFDRNNRGDNKQKGTKGSETSEEQKGS